jgi:deazaflavin-dependent oxidoreductase (nitroreductase family)
MNFSTTRAVNTPLSRSERVKLAIHRWLDRHLSPMGVWLMRRSKGRLTEAYKVNALLLTSRGRRSGRQRTVVLQYFADGDAMVVVAANDGGAAHPGWYFNLTTSPEAAVEVNGRRIPVRAAELDADEAAEWWRRILAVAPAYEQYRRATTRPFPILRLVPAEPGNSLP